MVKHIVMWKFREGAEEKAEEFLSGLKALNGQIDVIRSMEVGKNELEKNDCGTVLIATFDSFEDLEKYKTDPRHVAVSKLCKEIRESRHAVDFEF